MKVLTQADLPFSRISREFVGADHGDIGVCLIFVDAPPGRGPSLHQHPYAEVFIVQEGEGTFASRDGERIVRAGEIVAIPAETPHRFVNSGDGPLKLIAVQPTPSFSTEWLEE
jgi:mannose-6-phosphate isomerase-like protein (cupin superfamily)